MTFPPNTSPIQFSSEGEGKFKERSTECSELLRKEDDYRSPSMVIEWSDRKGQMILEFMRPKEKESKGTNVSCTNHQSLRHVRCTDRRRKVGSPGMCPSRQIIARFDCICNYRDYIDRGDGNGSEMWSPQEASI
ncbi:hypothetical protein J6590_056263 [Homalodisca vitripennis]|nr:hypothetical protein J6590_056261 [Homalodisca vitripennis]KAG8267214.1 hypothetical protein J6590_056263 [Homalodisca vitripennis]